MSPYSAAPIASRPGILPGRCFSISSVACTQVTDEIENARFGLFGFLGGRCFSISLVACTQATNEIENARSGVFCLTGSAMVLPFFLLLAPLCALAGPASDAGALASVLMWDTHPTVYAVLASLCGLAASVWGLRRVLRALGAGRGL